MDDVDRHVRGGSASSSLVREAKVDDRLDPVVDERPPALVRELADAVGANDARRSA